MTPLEEFIDNLKTFFIGFGILFIAASFLGIIFYALHMWPVELAYSILIILFVVFSFFVGKAVRVRWQ